MPRFKRATQRGIARRRPKLYLKNMGRTYHFDCPYCHYQARVSGGADTGLNCAVQTIVCLDCRQLFDVFTRLRQREGEEEPLSADAKTRSGRNLLPTAVVIPPSGWWKIRVERLFARTTFFGSAEAKALGQCETGLPRGRFSPD